jgi:hypothetical protein|tara:strand:- start:2042 stop:2458 length:417 start_codon:yes stop_codon:yes gene_type:complete
MLKYIALSISFFILLSCANYEYVGDPTTYEYDDCDYSDDKIIEYDLFQDFFILTLSYGYAPDISAFDSLLNDYYFLKFKNSDINGIYKISDADEKNNLNKVLPYNEISNKEYPFTMDLKNEEICIFLDLLKIEKCDCN